jgi:hypothetical protein
MIGDIQGDVLFMEDTLEFFYENSWFMYMFSIDMSPLASTGG